MKKWGLTIIVVMLLNQVAFANQSWNDWVAGVREEALQQGIAPNVFDEAFSGIKEPSRQIKGFMHSQPEHRLTFTKYLNTRADNYRIAIGRKEYKKNKEVLDEVAKQYGVNPCFIVSFWGMETSYGTYMGNFPVIKALATLAYDSKRKDFFRKELLLALHILNDGHVSLADFKGEWAGASGQPQFLPSSWVKYAVDYDGDGRKDIWRSKPDVFASIANYMKQNGWQTGEPWAIQVKLPAKFDMKLEGKTIIKPVSEWNALGVRTENGQPLPYQNLQASIVQPFGGPTFLAFPNYKMILRYNNSIYYAGAIGYMADKICQAQ
ncbi:lytic murein transglycosylase [Legionella bononiensis]|uniref:Lytic murein transglycosylase n=1 Tax=Legionella bononiensis TaxID=2793102 RepID=A0ABS1WFU2_9GAMM|nr:lytic murein transglycosylase [Legionella bononiensis]MBL7481676.1 lytic murein transglycosylase [Legionella bononiensis]MBL7528224.1 lytic murein transglycosylase [Legionella bononiensis]MBL7562699.1 lytic murein transglycosylase [Legionella bononiensis]